MSDASRLEIELESDAAAAAGFLTPKARASAIERALPLLGTYFSVGKSTAVVAQKGITREALRDADVTDRLLIALRFRVALASERRLSEILRRLLRQPNFRYRLSAEESVGTVRGRIDFVRFIRSRSHVESPPRYPILTVRRSQATPENVLAVSAVLWILRELRRGDIRAMLPPGGPEQRAASKAQAGLERILLLPAFVACRKEADRTLRKGELPQLLRAVKRRIYSGHVSNSPPYANLVEWLEAVLNGEPAAHAGDVDWAFYESAFDTKLFEIWALAELGEVLGDYLLEKAATPDLTQRSSAPMYQWRTSAGLVEVYFQRSIPSISGEDRARWSDLATGRTLRGTPDIVARVVPAVGKQRFIVVDPKLRQRGRAPVEEIYKLLGYFGNYALDSEGLGAIIFYEPKQEAHASMYSFGSDEGGRVLAVSGSPGGLSETVAFVEIRDLILSALGLSVVASSAESRQGRDPGSGADATEIEAGARQALESELLAAVAAGLGPSGMYPWVNLAENMLSDGWSQLTSEVQTMIATALYVGSILDADRDFSGPVLGICAAVERIIWDEVFDPARRIERSIGSRLMLGQMLQLLDDSVAGRSGSDQKAIRKVLTSRGVFDDVKALVPRLHKLNRSYRRLAAHRHLVNRKTWVDFQQLALVGGSPILANLVASLSARE